MPLYGPTHIPPIGEQTDPTKVRVAAVIGGQLASAPARGFGLTAEELAMIQVLAAEDPASLVATAQTRSRIVNGAMQVSQENGNTAGVGAWYPADQWSTLYSGTMVGTSQRVQAVTPNGSKDRYRFTVSTADTSIAAGDYTVLFTRIEGIRIADFRYGTASAKQSILRFGWKSPAGTYGLCLQNSATNRSYLVNFTVAAGQAGTDTEQVLVIPGDVTGTWLTDTGIGMTVYFTLATGTTYQGAIGWNAGNVLGTSTNSNGVGTAAAIYELFDIGFYLDPDATGLAPKWAMPDEAQELQACMRYWEQVIVTGYGGQMLSGEIRYASSSYLTTKRVTPSVTGVIAGGVSGFPNAVGTLGSSFTRASETRTANATASSGVYGSTITANARM